MAFLLFAGCSENKTPVLSGNIDHALDASMLQDSAMAICPFTRGAFPAWTLWREYADFLLPEEAQAIAFVSESILSQFSPLGRAKYSAIERFISQHSSCRAQLDSGAVISSDDSRNFLVHLIQTFPEVPNVPMPTNAADADFDELEELWLDELNQAFLGKFREHEISIRLRKNESGRYFMPTEILNSYAVPIQYKNFWNALESYDFIKARELLSIACVQNNALCRSIEPYWVAAQKYRLNIAQAFGENIEISNVSHKSIALPGNVQYSAVELTFANNGTRPYSHIHFMTADSTNEICEIQSEQTLRTDKSLTLAPGQTAKGWCALSAETPANVKLDFLIAY